ncbi:MAG: restriction endonuclease, partial [Bacteroidota bacterium]
MVDTNAFVQKESGEREPFVLEKLRHSLERVGAKEETIVKIINNIEHDIHDQTITSRKLFNKAYQELKKRAKPVAARYKLRKAIIELGPSGYPFERFIGEIFKVQGFDVQVGVNVQGHCVNHEIDVIAIKDNRKVYVECKFHRDGNYKNDVKIPLYIHSRYRDIERQRRKDPAEKNYNFEGWLITNTRFSDDALRYGYCSNMTLLGWDQPKKGNLKDRVDLAGLHPLTCLSSLTKYEKKRLLDTNIVLARHVLESEVMLQNLGLKPQRI